MSAIEGLIICSSLRSALAGGVGMPGLVRLTAPEVEAMIAGMPFEQKTWVDAVRGKSGSSGVLWGWLYWQAIGQANDEGWDIERGVERIGWMAGVVRDDMLRMDGSSTSGRKVAKALKLPETTYREGEWPTRYQWLGSVGDEVVSAAVAHLRRQMYAD